MREIKFRAWDKDRAVMCNNLLGDYSEDLRKAMQMEPHEYLRMLSGRYSDYPVLQFTGLKDKNGKEIYEGDIVFLSYESGDSKIYAVEWEEEDAAFYPGGMGGNYKEQEVIGNIYENPELLK